MSRIKIIKRADLQTPPERCETKTKKLGSAVIKRQAVRAVETWVDEWRAQKPKDARRARLADLFNIHSSAVG